MRVLEGHVANRGRRKSHLTFGGHTMRVSSLPYGLIAGQVRERGLEGVIPWVEACAANGLDGVEIAEAWLHYLNWSEVCDLIERIDALGLEVSAFNAFNARPNCPAGEARDVAVRQITSFLKMAERFGTGLLLIGSGAWADFERYRMSRNEAVDNTVETIMACMPAAAEAGVRILIENHPGWLPLWADVLVEMLQKLPPEVGLNIDTGSAYREGQRPQDFLQHGIVVERTCYVHLKSIRFDPDPEVGRWDQTVPFDQSDVDYDYILGRLKQGGFDGWISYESDRAVGHDGIATGAEFARHKWTEIRSLRSTL